MARIFDPSALRARLSMPQFAVKDARVLVRLILGVLLLANVVAALILFKPWGGSAEDLARREEELQKEAIQGQIAVQRTRVVVDKVEKARKQGDQFLTDFVLNRRTAFSTILAAMDQACAQTGIKPKERTFQIDEIEGSDTISIMTVNAGFEATYPNLTKFVNMLDRSPRFFIIESMQAAPTPAGILNVNIKAILFVREESGGAS